jgi:hypothetical protein
MKVYIIQPYYSFDEKDNDSCYEGMVALLDSIPDDDAVLTVENELMTVKITSVKEQRILKTVVKLKDLPSEENA